MNSTRPEPRDPGDLQDRADARVLGALSHPLRLRLLRQLLARPCCVGALTEDTQALQPAVSRHLGVLREAGLVTSDVDGRRRCYRLARPRFVAALLDLLDQHRPDPHTPDPRQAAPPPPPGEEP